MLPLGGDEDALVNVTVGDEDATHLPVVPEEEMLRLVSLGEDVDALVNVVVGDDGRVVMAVDGTGYRSVPSYLDASTHPASDRQGELDC